MTFVTEKTIVEAHLVKLLKHKQHSRGMMLIEEVSRCMRRNELHELVSTDQVDVKVGEPINRVGFLGFVEIIRPGVIEKGDLVAVKGRNVGKVLGFDDCHFPNHYNILVCVDHLLTGQDVDLNIGDSVQFSPTENIIEDVNKASKLP